MICAPASRCSEVAGDASHRRAAPWNAGRSRGDDRRQPSAGRGRPAPEHRRASTSTAPASHTTRTGIVVDRGLRTDQQARLCHRRRRRRRPAVHPCRQLSRRHRDPAARCSACRPKIDDDAVPWVTYTDPELAQVGLTEDRGTRHAGMRSRCCAGPIMRTTAPRPNATTDGHIKVVTNARGRILGATIVGAQAGELISTWTLAIAQRRNIRALAGFIVPYPTLAEIGKRAAMSLLRPRFDQSDGAAHHRLAASSGLRLSTSTHERRMNTIAKRGGEASRAAGSACRASCCYSRPRS